jgi:mRNA interferase MazF
MAHHEEYLGRRACYDAQDTLRMQKDFDRWNKLKKTTDGKDEAARLFFREGEVWWVHLGVNIGYETDGKRADFARPVVVLKKYN